MGREATQFQRGRSGNPGGRPKLPDDLKAAASSHSLMAIETLAKIMRDARASKQARVRAAEILLKKTIPDLSSVDMEAHIQHARYELSDQIPTEAEWEAAHCEPQATH